MNIYAEEVNGKTVEQLCTNFDIALSRLIIAEHSVLKEYSAIIMNESLEQIPIDTGALLASSYRTEVEDIGDVISVEFGYGGDNVQINPKTGQTTDTYSVRVHEDRTLGHPRGGKAFFLSDPVADNTLGFFETLKLKIREILEGVW